MIIVAIIALSAVVILALYAVLASLPPLSLNFLSVYYYMLDYIAMGASFVGAVTYIGTIKQLLSITIVVEGVIYAYKFTMWVAKKIPMFGVSD